MSTLLPAKCARIAALAAVLLVGVPSAAAESDGLLDSILSFFRSSESAAVDPDDATPGHVLRAAETMIAEIEILREELGVYDFPPEAELHESRTPIHMYFKATEIRSKVAQVQRRLGIPEVGLDAPPPNAELTYGDLVGSIEGILAEIRRIKDQLVIQREIEQVPIREGQSPAVLYMYLANASFLLDGLRGRPTTPDDVYLNTQYALDEIALVADEIGARPQGVAPDISDRKRPKDVEQQLMRAVYKTIELQGRLGMEASVAPELRTIRITPAENNDVGGVLLAELARVKLHLGIREAPDQRLQPNGQRPRDVFANALLIIDHLDQLIDAAG